MKINIDFDDSLELEFEIIEEKWNIYKLSDGSVLKIRPIVVKVFKSNRKTPDGQDLYGFGGQNIVSAKVPKSLKKGKKKLRACEM